MKSRRIFAYFFLGLVQIRQTMKGQMWILAGNPINAKQLFTIREKIDEIPTLLKIDFLDFAAVDYKFQNIAFKNAKEITL